MFAATSKTYDYIAGLVYENNALEFMPTAEGRVLPPTKAVNPEVLAGETVAQKNTFYRYEYQLKDHLGNLRVACRCAEVANPTSPKDSYAPIAVQENHYDPWGLALPFTQVSDKLAGNPTERFTYNGKEIQSGTGWLDYGARMYDPTIARWGVIDPLAEASEDFSPYQYAANNPIQNIDFLGLTDVNGDGVDDGTVLPELTVTAKRINDESTLNNIQTTLDVAGWVPGIQTVAGLTNAGIDIYRGNYGSALVNLGSSIPIAGYLFKGAKVAAMTTKVISSMAKMKIVKSALVGITQIRRYNGVITTAKYSQWTKIDGYQVHHIIPESLTKSFDKYFNKAGFDVNIGDNLRYLEEGFHTKHTQYTKYVREELQGIIRDKGTLTMPDINGVISNLQGLIDKAEGAYKSSGTTLNNYFK